MIVSQLRRKQVGESWESHIHPAIKAARDVNARHSKPPQQDRGVHKALCHSHLPAAGSVYGQRRPPV